MTTSANGMSDEVIVELNPTGPEPDYGPQLAALPPRPSASAGKSDWVTYVVALGLHPESADQYTKDELVELADRLGG